MQGAAAVRAGAPAQLGAPQKGARIQYPFVRLSSVSVCVCLLCLCASVFCVCERLSSVSACVCLFCVCVRLSSVSVCVCLLCLCASVFCVCVRLSFLCLCAVAFTRAESLTQHRHIFLFCIHRLHVYYDTQACSHTLFEQNIQEHIQSLNNGYINGLRSAQVEYINARGSFVDPHTIMLDASDPTINCPGPKCTQVTYCFDDQQHHDQVQE